MTTINVNSPCADNQATAFRPPAEDAGRVRRRAEQHSLTAMATGGVDTLECVLRKNRYRGLRVHGAEQQRPHSLVQGDNGPQASGYGQILRRAPFRGAGSTGIRRP